MQITTSTNTPTLNNKHGKRKGDIIKGLNSQRHRKGTQKMKQDKAEEIVSYLENRFNSQDENIDLIIKNFISKIKETKIDIIKKG